VREVRARIRSGDVDTADYHEECGYHYADKTRASCFREPSKVPPFEEWESGYKMVRHLDEGAAKGDRPTKKARRSETRVYHEHSGREFGCTRSRALPDGARGHGEGDLHPVPLRRRHH
jgi:hypothetical protein